MRGQQILMLEKSSLVLLPVAIGLVSSVACAAEIPAVVVQLAQKFTASNDDKGIGQSQGELINEYAIGFFFGFTHQQGAIWNAPEIRADAYNQGQSYWKEHPNERDNIFAGYGFVRTETTGVWSRSYERSSFVSGEHSQEAWWLSSLGDVRWSDLQPDQPDPISCKSRVRIVGYLSSKGHYGHLGAYSREFLATSVTCVD